MGNSNLETRSLLDELSSFEKGGFFDLGHPLLNRIAESFVKAAGEKPTKNLSKHIVSLNSSSFCFWSTHAFRTMTKHGLAAGVYSGLTYGLKEARGSHDWIPVQCAITGCLAAISTAANLLTGIF
uniref:Uncharacterized protein n=1 Tax=Fagus sylvatica TaxID=28930 RepID=A0A2N9EZJ5_FAGSY